MAFIAGGPPFRPSMDWLLARIQLAKPTCPAWSTLRGAKVQCITPGRQGQAFVHSDSSNLPGWEPVGACTRGALFRLSGSSCAGCPLASPPPNVQPISAEVSADGVRADFLMPDADAFRDLLAQLTATGQDPKILRFGRSQRPLERPKVLLGLDTLTDRQLEAIKLAVSMGYFQEGREANIADMATRMGCSRSTAHEHLQKGLQRLLTAAFEGSVSAA